MDYIKVLNEARIITSDDIDEKRFTLFRSCEGILKKDYPEIQKVWWISENTCDGGTQILIKCNIPVKNLDRTELNGFLAELLDAEIIYDYDRDFINNTGMVKSADSFKEWLEEGKIFILYNKEGDSLCRQ